MGVLIENPVTVAELQRRASVSGKSVDEIVAEALDMHVPSRYGALTEAQKLEALQALRELKEAFQKHRDPNDHRTEEEIIGYDEHGLPS